MENRRIKLIIGLLVVIGIYLCRLFYIQVLDDKYERGADKNSKVYNTIYPTRGIIYDRNGKILVGNKVSYNLMITPSEIKEEFDTTALAAVLDITPDFIKEKMDEYAKKRRSIGFRTITFLKQIPQENYIKFAEIAYRFPGFTGQIRSIRDYPYNAGGNLLGYVSEVDEKYIEKHPDEYKAGDYAGKTGIEAAREKDLRGEKGYNILLRNSKNQIEGHYADGMFDKEAIPGNNITTTIDAELQHYGQMLMNNKVGSLVAIEPSTGEILTMVSSPGIDVDILTDIGKHYGNIVSDPYKPMYNRAVQASYPPGSVFKIVNGLIGLQEGVFTPQTRYECKNGYHFGKNRLGCHSHKSPVDFEESIMMSCNAYYCYVLRGILENPRYGSIDEATNRWREYVMSFGFGQELGSDFPAEARGFIPNADYYNKYYRKGGWKATTVISISIGQGEILCTPLHLANFSATLANRGYYYTPHIIKDSENIKIDDKYKERHYTMVDTNHFHKVIGGMYLAVNSPPGAGGTASMAAVAGLDICGKTGTAQNPHGNDHSVFICFAPKDNPKIAVAAYVENAGWGGSWAAPIASLLTEMYLNGEISPERKYMEKRMLESNLLHKITIKKK